MLHVLKNYNPKHDKYVTLKNNFVDNASKFYKAREKIIEEVKNELFPFYYDREYEEQMKYEKEEEEETIFNLNKFNEWVNKQGTTIDTELFEKYFNFRRSSDMFKYLYQTNDKEKNNELVNVINSGLKDLKEEIKKMPKEEK